MTQSTMTVMPAEVMNHPAEWESVFLSSLLAVPPNYGTMIKPHDEPSGWLDLRVLNIQDGRLDISDQKYVDLPSTMVERHGVQDGDLLLARAIGSLDHLGKCFVAYPAGRKWAFDSHLMRLRFDQKRVRPEFVYHFLTSPTGRHEFLKHTRRSAVQFNINTKELARIRLPLPGVEEQDRILDILSKSHSILRKREDGIRLTEELLRSTFLDMFGDPATNPKGWDTEKLGELVSIRRGSSPRPIENYMGGDVPWIKIGDATKGDSFYITETADHVTHAGAEKSVLLEPGALVIANSGVSLGFARILKIKGCVHDGWLSLENLDGRLNKIYLLRLVNCLTDHFRAIAPEGTQPNLNTGIMKEFRVAIPPIDLQRKFEQAAYAIVEMTAARKKAAREAGSLFGSLVQRAFRGEL